MSSGNKLTLLDACGMAIGGMVGGGIFAVLGEAVIASGNAAFISLGIVLGISVILLVVREIYIWWHPRYKGKRIE